MLWRLSTTTCFKVYRSWKSSGWVESVVFCPKRLSEHNKHIINESFFIMDGFKNRMQRYTFFYSIHKITIFAPDLAKGMPCKSATVPAAVSPRKVCQSCHCPAHPDGKATDSGESEDLPNRVIHCKPSGTRAVLSVAIGNAACDGLV